MAMITLNDWYQCDFKLPSVPEAKATLLKIADLITKLQTASLVDSWFFLFEVDTIRVRMRSQNKVNLQKELTEIASRLNLSMSDKLPFSDYQEGDEMMFNDTFIESFANIMSEVTKLTISKLRADINFDNYRVLERIHHCMFDNLATLSFKPEEHFLKQRLQERIGQPFDSDFENKTD